MLDRTLAPQAHAIQGIALVEPQELTFDNGLKAFVFHAPDQNLIKAEFVFHNIYSEQENPILNSTMSGMIKEGTSRMNSAQIADAVDYYGAYLIPEFSFEHSALTLYTVNKHIGSVFPILFEILTDGQMPQSELDTSIRNNKQNLQISMNKNEYVAKKLFYENMFGENRYGVTASEERLNGLKRDDLLALYAQQIQPSNCTLFLSGNITAEVLDQVSALFGTDWKSSSSAALIRPATILPPASTSLILQEREGSLQSAIRIGAQTITRTNPDFPALQFVNTLFGGYFGSRLMQNIREDKGYTYGINSAVANLGQVGMHVIGTQVGVDVTSATLEEIRKEIDILHQTPAESAEIELVRNYLLGSMLGSLESIFSHADKFKAVYFSGMDLSYYTYYTNVVKEMDAARITEVAQQYFNYDTMVKVVVGKMA